MHIFPTTAIMFVANFPRTTIVRPLGTAAAPRPAETSPFPWLEEAQPDMLTDAHVTLVTAWLGEPVTPSADHTLGKRPTEEDLIRTPESQKMQRCRSDECPGAPLRVVPCALPKDPVVRRLW